MESLVFQNRVDPGECAYVYSGKVSLPKEMLTMDPRYPIGNFEMPAEVTSARRQQAMEEIASLPGKMRAAVEGLEEAQLDTPYRPGG